MPASAGHIWSKRYVASWEDMGAGSTVDPGSGSVLVTGNYWDPVDFGGGYLPAPSLFDMFLLKLAP